MRTTIAVNECRGAEWYEAVLIGAADDMATKTVCSDGASDNGHSRCDHAPSVPMWERGWRFCLYAYFWKTT